MPVSLLDSWRPGPLVLVPGVGPGIEAGRTPPARWQERSLRWPAEPDRTTTVVEDSHVVAESASAAEFRHAQGITG
jgi:hypothetical protein